MFAHGLFIEGARWAMGDEAGAPEMIEGTACAGFITDSRLKELLPALPLMYIKAVEVKSTWDPQSVGYMRHEEGIYETPLYTTTFRGPTYVFLATLKTKESNTKWVRAGVAIIMQSDQ